MKTNDNPAYLSSRITVPAAYSEVFSHLYTAANFSDQLITKTLLPSFQTILIFNLGSTPPSLTTKQHTTIVIDKCLVLGPIRQAFDYVLPPGSEILVINFIDDAFYRFFGTAQLPGHLPLHPDDLTSDNCFTRLWNQLIKLKDSDSRMNRILRFCDLYLNARDPVAAQLANLKDAAINPIKSVAAKNQQSERNIQLQHKKHFGYSAKELARYTRFLKATRIIQKLAAQTTKADWFLVIDECGYYDQSQLIHDFKHYINLTPAKYFLFQHDICHAAG